jgi:hypothetical protein
VSSSREPPSGAVPGGMESTLVIQDVEGQLGTGKKPAEIFDVFVSLWGSRGCSACKKLGRYRDVCPLQQPALATVQKCDQGTLGRAVKNNRCRRFSMYQICSVRSWLQKKRVVESERAQTSPSY